MRDLVGTTVAFGVIGTWAVSLAFWLAHPPDLALVPLVVAWQTFWHTGLFITAHDAIHGTVAPGRPRLNRAVGMLAARLYAGFAYAPLERAHHRHHAHPAEPGRDPDFHDGRATGFLSWYLRFARTYVTLGQILWMALAYNALHHLLGVGEWALWTVWVLPALLSTLQLFVVGTWLPHRGTHAPDDPHRARTLDLPPPLSLLACWHFGYHRAHHEHPGVPWYRLPRYRAG